MTQTKSSDPNLDPEIDEVEASENSDAAQAAQAMGELGAELGELQTALVTAEAKALAASEREKRALADYQNLIRRSQAERLQVMKLAGAEFASVLLTPLDHLGRAAAQIQDKGLNMVVSQFEAALKQAGLEEIPVMGQKFDVNTMEVVDTKAKGEKVIEIVTKGYKLNGEVIQHAKVVLG